jgi:hypothetical protein
MTKAKTFYAPELSTQELRQFERLRNEGPAEEIALLRVLIRRMLQTLNQVKNFQEAIQSVNALSYLSGRLAKLFEVQSGMRDDGEEVTQAYLMALSEVVGKMRINE